MPMIYCVVLTCRFAKLLILLSLTDGELLSGDDSTNYRSIVGALQ
jgi:hypothetical protein